MDLMHRITGTPWMLWSAVAGACTVVAFATYVLLVLRHRINAPVFTTQINKLLLAENVPRAVKLCSVVPGTWMARLCLFMLGLELPAKGQVRDQQGGGYRDATEPRDFAAELRRRVDDELQVVCGGVKRRALVTLVPMLAALGLGAVALYLYFTTAYGGAEDLTGWPFLVVVAPLLGTWWSAQFWRKDTRGLEELVRTVLPALRPQEEMDERRREAAAAARRISPGH
jgi:hypothetical protein